MSAGSPILDFRCGASYNRRRAFPAGPSPECVRLRHCHEDAHLKQSIRTTTTMAGHSQFKNIMHRKGRQDAAKSKLLGKLAPEITVSARLGLPAPAMNPRLRAAILAARAENMPKDNIDRAIKKAVGGDAESYDEIRYEGYGPGGVAVIVEVLTDNRNRTAGEVRATFTRSGGNLAATGAGSSNITPRLPVPKPCWKPQSMPARRMSYRARAGTRSIPRRIRCAKWQRRWSSSSGSRARRPWYGR